MTQENTNTSDAQPSYQSVEAGDSQPSFSTVEMRFGDTRSAVDTNSVADYLGVWLDNTAEYYMPPVSLRGLGQLLQANAVHGTLPFSTANWLAKYYIENPLLSFGDLKRLVIDYRSMGNGYLQKVKNSAGTVIKLKHVPAVNVRRKIENQYCWLTNTGTVKDFKPDEIWHLQDYDPLQQIYGVPYWFGALNSILLGEETQLFPRKFFKNGAHMGNLFATSDMLPSEETMFKNMLSETKGPGNWRSIHIGGMKGDVDKKIKVIPIGDLGDKIEFTRLAEASDMRILSAWRFRPELAGMMPGNNQSTGDLDKIKDLHYEYEIIPLQQEIMQINDFLKTPNKLKFKDIS